MSSGGGGGVPNPSVFNDELRRTFSPVHFSRSPQIVSSFFFQPPLGSFRSHSGPDGSLITSSACRRPWHSAARRSIKPICLTNPADFQPQPPRSGDKTEPCKTQFPPLHCAQNRNLLSYLFPSYHQHHFMKSLAHEYGSYVQIHIKTGSWKALTMKRKLTHQQTHIETRTSAYTHTYAQNKQARLSQ